MTAGRKNKILNCSGNFSDCVFDLAVGAIKRGGVIIFPTSSIYGLGGDAMCPNVVERIFSIKKRPSNKPISVLISGMEELKNVASTVPDYVLILMKKFWPGNVTFVVKANKSLPEVLTAGTGKIGIRVPLNRVAMTLVKRFGSPITATSANVSGNPGAVLIKDIEDILLNSSTLAMDAGLLGGGLGSTVVDTTTNFIKILREGTVTRNSFVN